MPAAQTVELSHSHAVAPALGALPEPHVVSVEIPAGHTNPDGQAEHTPNNDVCPAGHVTFKMHKVLFAFGC